MWKFVILIAVLSSTYAAPEIGGRIVNGTDAKEGEFRFAVSLRQNAAHVCGATILNRRFILTAAHCICDDHGRPLDAHFYSIQYGSVRISRTMERSVPVAQIFCHEYRRETLDNDVAVVELVHDIPNDGTWEPVKLAGHVDTSKAGKAVVIGWGRLWQNGPIPEILQKLEVETYTDTVCGLRFKARQHICFGARIGGACNGDSGTSLVSLDNEQLGVASFITNTCGTANRLTPNVYAKVDYFLSWIEERSRL